MPPGFPPGTYVPANRRFRGRFIAPSAQVQATQSVHNRRLVFRLEGIVLNKRRYHKTHFVAALRRALSKVTNHAVRLTKRDAIALLGINSTGKGRFVYRLVAKIYDEVKAWWPKCYSSWPHPMPGMVQLVVCGVG